MSKQDIDRSALVEIKTVPIKAEKDKKPEIITLDDDEPVPSSSKQEAPETEAKSTWPTVSDSFKIISEPTKISTGPAKKLPAKDTIPKAPRIDHKMMIMSKAQQTNYETLVKILRELPKNKLLDKRGWNIRRNMFKREFKKQLSIRSPKQQRKYYVELKEDLEKKVSEGNKNVLDSQSLISEADSNKDRRSAEKEVNEEERETSIKLDESQRKTFPLKKGRLPRENTIPSLFSTVYANPWANPAPQREPPMVNLPLYESQVMLMPIPPQMIYQDISREPTPPQKPIDFPDFRIPEPIRKEKVEQPRMTEAQITHLLRQVRRSSSSPSPAPQRYSPVQQQQQSPLQAGPGYNLLSERWWEKPLPVNDRVLAENFVQGITSSEEMNVYEIQLREQQERMQAEQVAEEERAMRNRLEEVERQIREIDRNEQKYLSMEDEFERRARELREREMRFKMMEEEFWRDKQRSQEDRFGTNQHFNEGFNYSSSSYMPSSSSSINISRNERREMPQHNQHKKTRFMKRREAVPSSSSRRYHYEDISPEGSPSPRKRLLGESDRNNIRMNFYDRFEPISDDEEGTNEFVMTIPDKMQRTDDRKRRRYTPPKDMVYVEVSDDEDHD